MPVDSPYGGAHGHGHGHGHSRAPPAAAAAAAAGAVHGHPDRAYYPAHTGAGAGAGTGGHGGGHHAGAGGFTLGDGGLDDDGGIGEGPGDGTGSVTDSASGLTSAYTVGGSITPPTSLADRVRALVHKGIPAPAPAGAHGGAGPAGAGDGAAGGDGESSVEAAAAAQAQQAQAASAQAYALTLVPTVFRWRLPAREAFVTGSFNGWAGKIQLPLESGGGGERALTVQLPPGVYYYKFIVDDQWRVDEDAPLVTVQGVVTNVAFVRPPIFAAPAAETHESDDERDARAETREGSGYGHFVPSQVRFVL